MKMKRYIKAVLWIQIGLFSLLPVQSTFAEQGDWIFRVRGIGIVPDDDSDQVRIDGVGTVLDQYGLSTQLDADYSVVPEFDLTYMLTDRIGIEGMATISNHDFALRGNGLVLALQATIPGSTGRGLISGTEIFDTWALPPTFILQYHFLPESNFRPYAGVGLNYTAFLWNDPTDALIQAVGGSVDVDMDNGVTWAAQIGFDMDFNDEWFVNVDVKYLSVDTEASINILNGPMAGTTLRVDTDLDPYVFGVGVGKRF